MDGQRLTFGDRHAARSFVARLAAAGHLPGLRHLARAELPVQRLDAPELLDTVARWITSGKLLVTALPAAPLPTWDLQESEPAPVIAPPAPRRVASEPLPPEEPALPALPPGTVDMLLQAAALRHAAEVGLPFCEECARKTPEPDDAAALNQASQAAVLRAAAEKGLPFCQECSRPGATTHG